MRQEKRVAVVFVILLMVLLLAACSDKPIDHVHAWIPATCTELRTCSSCGETEGEREPHSFENGICTVCGFDSRNMDQRYMDSLVAGLVARFTLEDANEDRKDEVTPDEWREYFNAEKEQLLAYIDASFVNNALEEWAKHYYESIVASEEMLVYYGTQEWQDFYVNGVNHDRSLALYQINELYPINVPDAYRERITALLENGEAINTVITMCSNMHFHDITNMRDGAYFEAFVENETAFDFRVFTLEIYLVDEFGKDIDCIELTKKDWSPGEQVHFKFSTKHDFDHIDVRYANWILVGEEHYDINAPADASE